MLAKDSLRYFSHDVDMRNDLKIRGLRRAFGNDGYAVWCYLLEVLTDTEDLCINIDTMDELLSADFDVTPEHLHTIVDYCLRIGLFQREGDMIFSTRHRERIMSVIDNAREKSERSRKAVMARWEKKTSQATTDVVQPNTDVIRMNTNKTRLDKIKKDKIKVDEIKVDKIVEYPCDRVVNLWNEICLSLPKVIRLSDARRDKIKARLREWGENDPEKMIDNARKLFERVEHSDFLTGRNGKWDGASFDWIFDSRNNWIKVMEGNYDNQRGGASFSPSSTKKLGVGEYLDENGNRTYGSGRTIIPQDAPLRPSERHSWNASNNQWILQ